MIRYHHYFIYFGFVFCVAFCGCQVPVLYSPPAVHVPMFDKAGQVEAGACISPFGVDGSIAFSPVNHLALFASGSWHDSRSDSTAHAFHAYREFGVAAYTPLKNRLHIQFGAGWGYGTALGFGFDSFSSTRVGWTESGKYSRSFAQAALQIHNGADSAFHANGSIVLRVSRVGFDSVVSSSGTVDRRLTGWFLEPVFVGRIGFNFAEVEYQVGMSDAVGPTEILEIDLFTSIGMRLRLDRLFNAL